MVLRCLAVLFALSQLSACAPLGAAADAEAEAAAAEETGVVEEPAPPPPGPIARVPADAGPAIADTPLGDGRRSVVMNIVDQPSTWDGEATTGGLWIALPYAPVRRKAIVTNPETGAQAVVTLLWRDPREGDGPTLLSASTARALGVPSGAKTPLNVQILSAE